jgi:hypothetical protein
MRDSRALQRAGIDISNQYGGSSHGLSNPIAKPATQTRPWRKAMINYTKPEVVFLGEADCVIENRTSKAPRVILETPTRRNLAPAYDLDE